jgi:hypothetical protein
MRARPHLLLITAAAQLCCSRPAPPTLASPTGVYQLHQAAVDAARGPDLLVINGDHTYYRFYGSPVTHAGVASQGRWRAVQDSLCVSGFDTWEMQKERAMSLSGTGEWCLLQENENGTLELVVDEDRDQAFVKIAPE